MNGVVDIPPRANNHNEEKHAEGALREGCARGRKGGSGQHLVRVSETMSNSSKFAFSYRCIDFRKKRTFLRKPHFCLILALWLPFCEKGGYWRFWLLWRVLAMTPLLSSNLEILAISGQCDDSRGSPPSRRQKRSFFWRFGSSKRPILWPV